MKAKMRKILSIVLATVMLLGLWQVTAFAEETNPELKLDTPYTLSISDDSYVYLDFTPDVTGDYVFRSHSEGASDPDIDGMYDGEGDELDIKYGDDDDVFDWDFVAVYTLTAGKTYTIEIEDIDATGDEFTVTVSKFTETVSGALSLGTSVDVQVAEGWAFYTFTPEIDGAYAIASKCATGSVADPLIGNVIDENGDRVYECFGDPQDYDRYEFMAVYELKANVKYTVCIIDAENCGDAFEVSVSKYYGFKQEPTAEKPSVDMFFPNDVISYEWYTNKVETVAITDENASEIDTDFGKSTYNSTTGVWTVSDSSYNAYDILETDIIKGDVFVVEVVSNGVNNDAVMIHNDYIWINAEKGDDGKYYITVDESATASIRVYPLDHWVPIDVKVTRIRNVIDRKLDAQTTDTLTFFNEGTEYTSVVTYKDGTVMTSNVVSPVYAISLQPTFQKPIVKANMTEGVTYQWYKANNSKQTVTDQNAAPFDIDANSTSIPSGVTVHSSKATYDAANNTWKSATIENSSMPDGYFHYFFTKEFAEGDKVVVEIPGELEQYVLFSIKTAIPPIQGDKIGKKVVFTVPADEEYTFAVISESKDLIASAYIEKVVSVEKLDGQTTDTLTKLERGATYYCDVTFNNEKTIASNMFKVNGHVTHQPTVDEPYTQVTFPEEVKGYQWYEVKDGAELVTDEMAEAYRMGGESAEFDSATGKWTGAVIPLGGGKYGYSYFTVELKEGDTLTVEMSDEPVEIYFYDLDSDYDAEYTVDGNTITFEVSKDGRFRLDIATRAQGSTAKARIGKIVLGDKVEGQTEAALTAAEAGKRYACVVTYKDGAELQSDCFMASKELVQELKDKADVENFDKLVNAIPEVVDLKDKDAVMAAKKLYDSMSDEAKKSVADELVEKLEKAVKVIEELEAEVPATGDNSNSVIWMLVMLMSAVSLVGALAVLTKKEN